MDKEKRKKDIAFMSIAAGMAAKCRDMDGIIGPGFQLDQRFLADLVYKPTMLMLPNGFLEYFGDDTDFEYITRTDGEVEMVTEVNGVTFYALIDDGDMIKGGRIV